MIKKLALGVAACTALALSTHAQTTVNATDNASNAPYVDGDGWNAGDNGGTGFGAWTTVTQGFVGSSANNGNGGSGNINTSGLSWGLFSNTGAPTLAQAIRPLSSALQVGQTFSLDVDTGFIGSGGSQGFTLLSGGTTAFEFYFAGGSTSYTVAGSTNQSTQHGFTADGMTTSLTLTSPGTFQFTITFNSGTPTTETFTGQLQNGLTSFDTVRFFDFNPNQAQTGSGSTDAFFNNMSVTTAVPEPSSLGLLAGPAILGAWFYIRRRRA